MKEKDFNTSFGKWLKANKWNKSAAFELKICKCKIINIKNIPSNIKQSYNNLFRLRQIEDHQLLNLRGANEGLHYFKIPDAGFQNPFDCYTLYKVPAYVVILFYEPRKEKRFWAIPIVTIQGMIDDGIKSINEDTAARLCEFSGVVK